MRRNNTPNVENDMNQSYIIDDMNYYYIINDAYNPTL